MAASLGNSKALWVALSTLGGLAAGLLLHARDRLARELAALEVRVLNIESRVDKQGARLCDACFMSEHNGKVLSLLCEQAGWGLEHAPPLRVQRSGMSPGVEV